VTERIFGVRLTGYVPQLFGLSSGFDPPPPAVQGAAAAMRSFITYVDDQIGSRCTGDGFEDARWIAVGGQGKRGSPHGLYTAGRMRERARKGAPVSDVGADPWDVAEACVSVGVYPRDANDDDPGAVNKTMNWNEESGLRLFDISHLHPIEYGDLETVDGWHAAGCPVVFWTAVDQAFMNEQAGQVWPGITNLPILGSHCRVLLPRPPGMAFYEEWNSYGPQWGTGGIGRLSPAALSNAGLCAVSGGPVL